MLKSILSLLFISFFFVGCNSGNGSEEVIHETVKDSAVPHSEVPTVTISNKPSLWSVEMQPNSPKDKLQKPIDASIETLSAPQIIDIINEKYSEVNLHFTKISHDTIFLSIPESARLTNQMGSTGAYNYMATVVYNLTELKTLKFIKFDFKEGDHASPGVYSREDFKSLR
ncbi:MAG: hypothetical protein ABI208_09860 [Ginsengibacter sp.]|jgi:PBP1b-binding outer membrane lipoprotein LpoB